MEEHGYEGPARALPTCASRGRVYSLPLELYGHLYGLRRGCAHVTPLQTKLLPHLQPGAAEQEQEAFLEQDDPLPPQPLLQPLSLSLLEDAEGDIGRRVGSLVFFSVVDTKPSRTRIIPIPPGAAARLGPDDIQVARHDLSGQQDGGQTGFTWLARLGALPPMRVNKDGLERKVFTSMRSKTRRQALRASYARCLLQAEELWALLGDDAAILEIGHYEKESYYKELLARLRNRGEQQFVAVNPCQACLIRQRMVIDSRSHVWSVGDRGGLRGWVESDLACVYLCFLQCAFLFSDSLSISLSCSLSLSLTH